MVFSIIEIILFYISYRLYGLHVAVISIISLYVFKLFFSFYTQRNIKKNFIITLIVVSVGGLSLYWDSPKLLQWKLTIVFLFFSVFLYISNKFFDKNFIKLIYGKKLLNVEKKVWDRVNIFWVLLFFCFSIINIYLTQNCTVEQWVEFKTFGSTGIIIASSFLSVFYILYKDPSIKINKDIDNN